MYSDQQFWFLFVVIHYRDVNETRETRDSKKFLGIENFISHGREFQAAGPHARSFNDRR